MATHDHEKDRSSPETPELRDGTVPPTQSAAPNSAGGESALGQVAPVSFRLDRQFWIAAGVIAWLRLWVNDPIRGQTRDRGSGKNWLNDLQGAVGELLARRRLEQLPHAIVESDDLVDFAGPVDRPDLIVRWRSHGTEIGVEAKALLWEPGKSRFLINKIAHDRSRRRGAIGYIPSVSTPGGAVAIVGAMILTQEVAKWSSFDPGYGDPALSISLSEMAPRHFGDAWAPLRNRLVRAVVDIESIRQDSADVARRWRDASVLPTSGMGARQTVEFLGAPPSSSRQKSHLDVDD